MKIIFNLMNCGLGNNGGSLSIIKSANTLKQLGHEVYLIDSGKNKHTWTELIVPHIRIKHYSTVPDADIIIATGYGTVKTTLQLPSRCGLKTHWIRGWETWKMPEKRIVTEVLKAPTIKLVNSFGLQKKLNFYDINSYIVRPGYDFDDYYPTRSRLMAHRNTAPTLGGLYHSKHKTKRSDWILQFRHEYKNVGLWMFGASLPPYSQRKIDQYFLTPSIETKREIYNNCAIWLAPTALEGSHIVPAEAMLTECPIIGTNAPLAGMDYLIDGQTGLIANNTYESFRDTVIKLLQDTELQVRLGKQARQQIIRLGNREENMRKMIELFENFL